ncbi:MAG TPA: tRNA lysidine(34) synthetase TilS [Clostridiaceae bacterium]|jgi:tRNA(Ile)-lysidine synthase|nr:tRNA lysidine(34) synthetase TilS [Clostridiaceae bacterium]
MVVETVERTIEKHGLILPGQKVIVGISGGPDSVCLLHVLKTLSSKLNITLHAVHVNHMLRGDESLKDEEFVVEFCSRMDVPLTVKRIDINEASKNAGVSLEVAGRHARYGEMEKAADEHDAQAIAVAHNMNDQAETVLMNIIRGTGLHGLKGIPYRRGRVVRPLLDVRRNEIEEYCVENKLNPRIDSSNLTDVYTRNKVRLKIIPEIDNTFGVDIIFTLQKMAQIVREDNDFIEDFSLKLFSECLRVKNGERVVLDIPKLEEYHKAIQRRIIRIGIRELKGDVRDVGIDHVEDVINLALAGSTGSVLHLPNGIRAEKSYDSIVLYIENPARGIKFCHQVEIPGVTYINNGSGILKAEILRDVTCIQKLKPDSQTSLKQLFDYDKINGGIYIRTRENGDLFKAFKSPGTKKLKDYFIDKKIPREVRDRIPLIASGNEIIWVIGQRISDKFKVSENTKNILVLEYKGKLSLSI